MGDIEVHHEGIPFFVFVGYIFDSVDELAAKHIQQLKVVMLVDKAVIGQNKVVHAAWVNHSVKQLVAVINFIVH